MSDEPKPGSWPLASEDHAVREVALQTGCTVDEVLEAIDDVGPDRARVIARLRGRTSQQKSA